MRGRLRLNSPQYVAMPNKLSKFGECSSDDSAASNLQIGVPRFYNDYIFGRPVIIFVAPTFQCSPSNGFYFWGNTSFTVHHLNYLFPISLVSEEKVNYNLEINQVQMDRMRCLLSNSQDRKEHNWLSDCTIVHDIQTVHRTCSDTYHRQKSCR